MQVGLVCHQIHPSQRSRNNGFWNKLHHMYKFAIWFPLGMYSFDILTMSDHINKGTWVLSININRDIVKVFPLFTCAYYTHYYTNVYLCSLILKSKISYFAEVYSNVDLKQSNFNGTW